MTTWQDEAPLSRRALRERERAQSQTPEPTNVTPPTNFATLPPQPSTPAAPLPPSQEGSAPSYRVRDYSPDARGSQFSTVGGPPQGGTETTRPPVSAAPTAPPAPSPVAERILTRRELRELRDAAEHQASSGRDMPPPELVDPLASRAPESRVQDFAAPMAAPQVPVPVPPHSPAPPQQPFTASAPPQEWGARQPEPAPDVMVVTPAAYAPPAPEFELAPHFDASIPQREAPGDPSAVSPSVEMVDAQSALVSPGFARPEGHWSRQEDLDARTQRDDVLPSRDLSQSNAITTSALVLPAMPPNPIGPLSSTGEILVTGSIDLPRMLGATGVHPARFDHSEVDSIIEAGDREDSHPNSAPVRAIRAVSTHTSTQGIIAAKRPRSKVPTYVLVGVATIMGIGVVVLFVGGMLLDLF